MPRRAAHITQADIARAIRAAKQEGAAEVEVRVDGQSSIVIRLDATFDKQGLLTQNTEIVL